LQEANEVKKALEKIGEGLPDRSDGCGHGNKEAALETAVDELDAVNAERTRLVDVKVEKTGNLNDHIVQVRSAVKGIFGADSEEYDMVGGTRTSERKRHGKKSGENLESPEGDGSQ
jgi:hypothetical protein